PDRSSCCARGAAFQAATPASLPAFSRRMPARRTAECADQLRAGPALLRRFLPGVQKWPILDPLCSPARNGVAESTKGEKVPMEEEIKKSSRRSFLGGMTALTAASYNRVLGANDRVGVGFIGFGLIGKQHIYNFKTSFKDVDRVALCDVYKPRVAEGLAYMESPNAKGYGDFRKM